MKDPRHNELEELFNDRSEQLLDFYDFDSDSIPCEEEESLLPILNSLQGDEDRYEEIEQIAEGGEKRIFRAFDHRLNREIAMARAARAKNRQDHEQFLREARLEANLSHPNIVPVHNIGIDSTGEPYFTMELIPGDSLKTIFKQLRAGNEEYKQRYPLTTLLDMFLKISDAIAYAHARNVIHLDIKPDNIRVGRFGEVFVCDWGLAMILFDEKNPKTAPPGELDGDVLNDMTLTGTIKGTPGFMAPEQVCKHGNKTPQTDIYALGALLYMLLTYELPVNGVSSQEIVKNTKQGKIVPPLQRKTERIVPTSLSAVTLKALALQPADRYPSVLDLKKDIQRYLTGFPTSAESAGPWLSLSLLVKRHNRLASLVLFFLLLIAFIISMDALTIREEKADAIAAREAEERHFRLYREQQDEVKKLGGEIGDAIIFAIKSKDLSRPTRRIQGLETALTHIKSPKIRREILALKAVQHFVIQEFNEALNCFEEAGSVGKPSERDCWNLSRKYAAQKPDDNKLLSTKELTDLVINSKGRNPAVYYLYHNHLQRASNTDPMDYLTLAKAILDRINQLKDIPLNEALNLTKTEQGLHLDLTRTPYTYFTLEKVGIRRNLLAPLNLHSLDISSLPIRSLSEFSNLKVRELRMVGLNIVRENMLIKHLVKMGVQTLIIDLEAYPPETQRMLRWKFDTIEEYPDHPTQKAARATR